MKRMYVLLLFFISAALLAGCSGATPSKQMAVLRIGVLPILDTLPLYVAEAQGYFTEAQIRVEFVVAASAAERDQLLQAGQIDGSVNDLVAIALYNKETPRLIAVRYAMTATPVYPQFRILAAANAGIAGAADLRGVEIGISEGTVIEYVTTRLLEAQGLAPADIKTLAVPKIPDRLGLLGSGELQAATLPEPLASLALQQGATVVVDDSSLPEVSCSVISFRKEVLEAQPETVRAFLNAVERAVQDINADKPRWDSLLTEKQLVPAPLAGVYMLPDYPVAAVPTIEQFADVARWLQGKNLIQKDLIYSESFDGFFVP